MYNYEWDNDTGGYVLLPTKITGVSKEVRPVFYEELVFLGLDKGYGWEFEYSKNPLMWAEGRRYIYHGEVVAEATGGGIYSKPVVKNVKNNIKLYPVDIDSMVSKNESLMNGIVQSTLKDIYKYYNEYSSKVDVIYAAFSGGKDSVVMLDLVQRALPHDKFCVIFGDTTMELNDTYVNVENAKKKWSDLDWHTAKTEFDSTESWKFIGPPARTIRWCCSVHKSAPSIRKIKEIIAKKKKCTYEEVKNFKVLAFLGVRAEESEARSNYDVISDGNKHAVQINCNPILKWSTSELFLYLFSQALPFNKAYRNGLSRVGCLLCPMSSSWTDCIQNHIYGDQVKPYIDIIRSSINKNFENELEWHEYMMDGGWKKRAGGKVLTIPSATIFTMSDSEYETIVIRNSNYSWKKWLPVFGDLVEIEKNKYVVSHRGISLTFFVEEQGEDTLIKYVPLQKTKDTIRFMYLFKNALNKSAFCKNCMECEVECPNGALKITKNDIVIDGCKHCEKCLDRQKGCIVARSLMSKGENNMDVKNIDRYKTFGLRQEWIEAYFENPDDFWTSDRLGKDMFYAFERWGREAGIIDDKKNMIPVIKKFIDLGADSPVLWGYFYANMAYNSPIITWYIKKTEPGTEYSNDDLLIMLGDDLKERTRKNALASLFNTIKSSPLGFMLGQGTIELKGKIVSNITREFWDDPDPIIILYTLYLFAEHFDDVGLYSFTLSDLVDDSDEREALSPCKIFGIDLSTLKPILQGLANDYPEFIQVDFNKDIMENIDLPAGKAGKKAIDVLELI